MFSNEAGTIYFTHNNQYRYLRPKSRVKMLDHVVGKEFSEHPEIHRLLNIGLSQDKDITIEMGHVFMLSDEGRIMIAALNDP